MENVELFEKAARLKLRFETPQGVVTAEDLWDLPLTSAKGRANLDDVAKDLAVALNGAGAVQSFVNKSAPSNERLETAFALVKRVIDVRLAEREAAETARTRKAQKERILELIERKEDEALAGKSMDELRQLAAAL